MTRFEFIIRVSVDLTDGQIPVAYVKAADLAELAATEVVEVLGREYEDMFEHDGEQVAFYSTDPADLAAFDASFFAQPGPA